MKIEITERQVQYMESTAGNLEGFEGLSGKYKPHYIWERFEPIQGLYTEELYKIEKELDDDAYLDEIKWRTKEGDNHPKLVAYYDKYFPQNTSSIHFYDSYLELVIVYNFYQEKGAMVCGIHDMYRESDDKYCLLINKTIEELDKKAEF